MYSSVLQYRMNQAGLSLCIRYADDVEGDLSSTYVLGVAKKRTFGRRNPADDWTASRDTKNPANHSQLSSCPLLLEVWFFVMRGASCLDAPRGMGKFTHR